jgi:hypothetical protein
MRRRTSGFPNPASLPGRAARPRTSFPKPRTPNAMRFDLKRVAAYIRRADTEELLDRVTVYREGMEPAALDLMEMELDRRGVSRADIADHDQARRQTAIMLPDGTALRCSFCDRPAVLRGRGWHRLFRRIPVFPRVFSYCDRHDTRPRPVEDVLGE